MMVTFMLLGMSRAKVSADRINEVLSAQVAITDAPEASAVPIRHGSVRFEQVSFRYQGSGKEEALKQINLKVDPGQVVGILGATGSGKSTLVHLIPRLYDPTRVGYYRRSRFTFDSIVNHTGGGEYSVTRYYSVLRFD